MSEYYKQLSGTPKSSANTTGADRIQADREIWAILKRVDERLAALESTTGKLPSVPVDDGAYALNVLTQGQTAIYSWQPVREDSPTTKESET